MLDPTFHITTPRLYLTYIQPTDPAQSAFFLKLYNPPEHSAHYPFLSAEAILQKMQLDELEQDQANTGFGRYLVWLKDPSSDHSPSIPLAIRLETCQMIGGTTLKIRPASGCPIPDIGFNFYKPFWGKGYANEATTALMRYFEEERGVTEVFGFTDATNLEANKLFGRLGFEDRGVKGLKGIREGEIQCVVWAKKGMNEDLRVYGIS